MVRPPRDEQWQEDATLGRGPWGRGCVLLKCRNQKGPEETGTRVGLLRGSTGLGLRANEAKTWPETQSAQRPLAPFSRCLTHTQPYLSS